jgi:hypothetical protein
MPHNLIVPFCLACRVSVEWLPDGNRTDTVALRLFPSRDCPLGLPLPSRQAVRVAENYWRPGVSLNAFAMSRPNSCV